MSENNVDKKGIVSSIFDRDVKKPVPTLFGPANAPKENMQPIASGVRMMFAKVAPYGIDIGSSSIKAVQLGSVKGGGLSVARSFKMDIEVENFSDPSVREQTLPGLLGEFVSKYKLRGNCYVSMPPDKVAINFIELPDMPDNEIPKALEWEMKQRLRVDDLNDIYFDYVVAGAANRVLLNNRVGVLAVSAEKKVIKDYLDIFRAGGLNPLALDAEQLSTFALIEYMKRDHVDGEVMVSVELGAGSTYMSVICNGEIMSVRPLRITGNYITGAIKKSLNTTWAEAEKLKKKAGFSSGVHVYESHTTTVEETSVMTVISPLMEDLVRDIEHTFKYFSHQVTRSQVVRFDKIILTGGGSVLKGFLPFLKEKLGVEIIVADPAGIFGTASGVGKGEACGPEMAVACGLAMRGSVK